MQIDNNNEACPEEPCGKPLTNCEDDAVVIPSGNMIGGCTVEGADNYNPEAEYQNELCTYCNRFNVTSEVTQPTTSTSNDGEINITAYGVTPAPEGVTFTHTYNWTTGYQLQDLKDIGPGIYICEVTQTFALNGVITNTCTKAIMVVVNVTDDTTYGCINATPGDFPDVNGLDNNGVSCPYPCAEGYLMFNYDPNSEISDGSCIEVGCTDSDALNYAIGQQYDCLGADVTADGWVGANGWNSCCTYCVDGCTNPEAINYNPDATCDNGSCAYYWQCVVGKGGLSGCVPATAGGVSAYLTQEDCFANIANDCGSIGGCTNPDACNFNTLAQYDNGDCTYECIGCHDFSACNYEPNTRVACANNSCCTYINIPATFPASCDCDGNIVDECGVCDGLGVDECGDCFGRGIPKKLLADGTEKALFCDCFGNVDDRCGVCGGNDDCVGCMQNTACNYEPGNAYSMEDEGDCLVLDCAGNCGGPLEWDVCGTCNGDAEYTNGEDPSDGFTIGGEEGCDCDQSGVDDCGVCGGGVTFGTDLGDDCDCDENNDAITLYACGCGNPTVVIPPSEQTTMSVCSCDGEIIDECGACLPRNLAYFAEDDNTTPGDSCGCSEADPITGDVTTYYTDDCGECNQVLAADECLVGCDVLIMGCNGDCGSGQVIDECGVCNGGNATCAGCTDETACNYDVTATVSNATCEYTTCADCCGVPDGDGSTCDGACGACNDNTSCEDACGVPNGDGSSCWDCCQVSNGDGTTCDGDCGACNDDTSCEDECGVPNGSNDCIGCTDSDACNYDPLHTIDTSGVGSCIYNDQCGVCGGDNFFTSGTHPVLTTNGACNCDGIDTATGHYDGTGGQYDACNVCDGPVETTTSGEAGTYCNCNDLTEVWDACNICDGPGDVYDCGCEEFSGNSCECDGPATYDACGVCGGPGIPDGECLGTDGTCDGTQIDDCGNCGGDIVHVTCDGTSATNGFPCGCIGDTGGATYCGECGQCNGSGILAGNCDCAGNVLDECGVCGGGGQEIYYENFNDQTVGASPVGISMSTSGNSVQDHYVNNVDPIMGTRDLTIEVTVAGTTNNNLLYPSLNINMPTSLVEGVSYVLTFDWKWISGTPTVSKIGIGASWVGYAVVPATTLLTGTGSFVHHFTALGTSSPKIHFNSQLLFEVQIDNISINILGNENNGLAVGACDCAGNIVDECGVCGGTFFDNAAGYCGCDDEYQADLCGTCPNGVYLDGAGQTVNGVTYNICSCPLNEDGSLDSEGLIAGDYSYDLCIDPVTGQGVCGGHNESCAGCMDDTACNYDATATFHDSAYCVDPDECGECSVTDPVSGATGPGIADGACDCDGNVLDDCNDCGGNNTTCLDCCGVPNGDGLSCTGDCGECNEGIPVEFCDCDGNVLDASGECGGDCPGVDDCGFCQGDNSTCTGCMDAGACNYDSSATISGDCEYTSCEGCMDITNPGYNPLATIACADCCLVGGCMIPYACNYDPDAEYQLPEACEFSTCAGCTDPDADNEDPTATLDDGSCIYVGCMIPNACNFDPMANSTGDCIFPDECGNCYGSGIPDGNCDCYGHVLDECGVCGGSGIAEGYCDCQQHVEDACGVCGGTAVPNPDDNGVNLLDGTNSGVCSCGGVIPELTLDACNDCGGGVNTSYASINANPWTMYPPSNESFCDCTQALTFDYGTDYIGLYEVGGTEVLQGDLIYGTDYTNLYEVADIAAWEAALVLNGGAMVVSSGTAGSSSTNCGCMSHPDVDIHHVFLGPESVGKICGCNSTISNTPIAYYWDSCGICMSLSYWQNLGVFFTEATTALGPNLGMEGGVTMPATTNSSGPGLGDAACGCLPTNYNKADPVFPDVCGTCGGNDPFGNPQEGGLTIFDAQTETYDYDGDGPEEGGYCDCNGNTRDCAGVCAGTATFDECGICGGAGSDAWECFVDGECSNIAEGTCNCFGDEEDECGVCDGDATGPGIPEGDCDCAGSVLDECGYCGGSGILDGYCDCAGNILDACGVCGGVGIAGGACDCSGNTADVCLVCGGGATNSIENSGWYTINGEEHCNCNTSYEMICGVCGNCDSSDLTATGCGPGDVAYGICGCTDSTACNYSPGSNYDDGTCTYQGAGECDCYGNELDCDQVCGGNSVVDICGTCGGDNSGCGGCMDGGNWLMSNDDPYDSTVDPYTGQTLPACNYNAAALAQTVPCNPPDLCGQCTGPNTGDNTYCTGCMTTDACNYDAVNTIADGLCDYSCYGCTDPNANNYDTADPATIDNGTCTYGYECEAYNVPGTGQDANCDGVTVTMSTGSTAEGALYPFTYFYRVMSKLYFDDVSDDTAYCTKLSDALDVNMDCQAVGYSYDGATQECPGIPSPCAACTWTHPQLTGNYPGLKIGLVYKITSHLGTVIRSGSKGPTNWNETYITNSSYLDMFQVRDDIGLSADVWLDEFGLDSSMLSAIQTMIASGGADYLDVGAYIINETTGYQNHSLLTVHGYSCCCDSAIDPTVSHHCVEDPQSWQTLCECKLAAACCLDIYGGPNACTEAQVSGCNTAGPTGGLVVNTGCTDNTATNYDSSAIFDDGSCTYTSWTCQEGALIGNACSDLDYMHKTFADTSAIITHITDSDNGLAALNLQKFSFSLLNAKQDKASCYSVPGLQNSISKVTHPLYSIKSLNITSGKGTVFAGNSWKALIKFLYNKKMSVVEGTTYAEALVAIAASAYTDYTIGLTIAPCSCTYGPCSCVPDVNGTHTTQAACQQETTNCCT